ERWVSVRATRTIRNVSLGTLDPVAVVLEEDTGRSDIAGNDLAFVKVVSAGGRSSISVVQYEAGTHENGSAPWPAGAQWEKETGTAAFWRFGFHDRGIASRVAAAFKHAIKLCGGKVDPF